MTERRTIHLVDDDEAVRQSVAFLLSTYDVDVVSYPSGATFLAGRADATPGCLMLDIRMPELDGLEMQRRLNEEAFDWPVIFLTGHGEVRVAVEAMQNGAVDFIEKPFYGARLIEAVDNAFRQFDKTNRARRATQLLGTLSERERQVLDALVHGLSNKAIARSLGISARTVEAHRAHIMAKLHADSFADVLRIALTADTGPAAILEHERPAQVDPAIGFGP